MGSLLKGHQWHHKDATLMTSAHPKNPTSKYHHLWGLEIQHVSLGGHTHSEPRPCKQDTMGATAKLGPGSTAQLWASWSAQ